MSWGTGHDEAMIRHTVAFSLRHAPSSVEEVDFLAEGARARHRSWSLGRWLAGRRARPTSRRFGYQAHDHTGAEQSGLTSNSLIQAVRPTGRIGVVGVFILEDPTASDELAQQGRFAFDFGTFFLKGQSMGTARPTSSSTTGRCAT